MTKELNKEQWSKLNKEQRRERIKHAVEACHTEEAIEKRKKIMTIQIQYIIVKNLDRKLAKEVKSFQKMGKAAWDNEDNHEAMNPVRFNRMWSY